MAGPGGYSADRATIAAHASPPSALPTAPARRAHARRPPGGRPAAGRSPRGGGVKRLSQAPNLAIATLWADVLNGAGFAVSVQRAFASSIAGEIPPDQALPELWLADAAQLAGARALLHALQNPPERRWACRGCGEVVEGPFDTCWSCGAAAPPLD
jgi:hypothetical protein